MEAPHLLVQVLQLLARQLELRHLRQQRVPAAIVDVRRERLQAVHGVERDLALILQRLERLLQRILLAELKHYLDDTAHQLPHNNNLIQSRIAKPMKTRNRIVAQTEREPDRQRERAYLLARFDFESGHDRVPPTAENENAILLKK